MHHIHMVDAAETIATSSTATALPITTTVDPWEFAAVIVEEEEEVVVVVISEEDTLVAVLVDIVVDAVAEIVKDLEKLVGCS